MAEQRRFVPFLKSSSCVHVQHVRSNPVQLQKISRLTGLGQADDWFVQAHAVGPARVDGSPPLPTHGKIT